MDLGLTVLSVLMSNMMEFIYMECLTVLSNLIAFFLKQDDHENHLDKNFEEFFMAEL